MACMRHLWSADLAMVTFLRLDDLITFYVISYSPYMANLGSLSHSHGLEETHLVHRPVPGQLKILADLIIGHFLSTSPIMPNSGSLCHPHALEEAPVAH